MSNNDWQRIGESKDFVKFLAQIEAHKAEMGIGDPPDIEPCEFSAPDRPHPPKIWPDGSYCDGGGFVYTPDGRSVYKKRCPCWIKAKQRDMLIDYGRMIPLEFRGVVREADDTKFACATAFSVWHPTKSPGLFLVGRSGIGKTVAAHRAAMRMIPHHGVGGYYISCRSVAADCSLLATDTTEKYRAEERLTRHILACRGRFVVVLDDLGRERQSEATIQRMCEYIDALYERRAPCVITTNIGGAEIKARYGADICSRLTDTSWVTAAVIRGEDLRLEKNKPEAEPEQETHFQTMDEMFKPGWRERQSQDGARGADRHEAGR